MAIIMDTSTPFSADMKDLPKAYEASNIEADIYQKWEDSGAFNPDELLKLDPRYKDAEPYCIVLPPPNRTGNLHMGHAKTVAIEDILIRFHRMLGRKTYWVPGTDHAAIATQVKVEQQLIKQGIKDPRRELGREKFLEKVREFAQGSRDNIVSQCKAMGGSMDWKLEKYTLDEQRNRAVNQMFKMMHEDGLIERGYRVVNWDPRFKTTLSDDEVLHKETQAELITFKYDKDFPIAISTTRPETKFGDTAVAVNPDDKRYAQYVGQTFTANYCGKEITVKVVADKEVDMNFGTGALGVTPAHSMIDAEIAERHGLPMVQVINEEGCMKNEAGPEFFNLTTIEARKKAVQMLDDNGLVLERKDILQNLMVAERGGETVEQLPMFQWFVRVNKKFKLRQDTLRKWKKGDEATLKDLMRHSVESGQIRILPENQVKIYFHWVDNLRDWCISRQIWFGHQIPVWYKLQSDMYETYERDPDSFARTIRSLGNSPIVALEKPEGERWVQHPDTLDTWFSSGMWTFSTLGWPDENEWNKNRAYHPTDVLETGRDIIFFWVARMILMTTYALGEVPFNDAYLHGLVLDEKGRKMSKSLGNTIEPLEMIPKYGTDAVRLSLVMGTSPGMDQKLSEDKIKDFRNFTNKLWNISRFILQSTSRAVISTEDVGRLEKSLADKWILSKYYDVQNRVTQLLEQYQFSQAGELLRDFTWGDFADWYLEVAKIEKNKDAMLWHILPRLLKLWHPFMPFVTEYIWEVGKMGEQSLIVSEWPSGEMKDEGLVKDFEQVKNLITDLRRLRSENGVEPVKLVDFAVVADEASRRLIEENMEVVKAMSRAQSVTLVESIAEGWATAVSGTMTIGLDLAGAIDVAAEKSKLQKEIDGLKPYIASTEAKLQNKEFTSKAPEKVVAGMQAKLDEAKAKISALEERLTSLK
ncbi:MAG: valine--tRNA ligase [Patescibacteria group bacterium]|nr:valine--tRNA ligase [Patescibacteria group bacterium]